MYLNSFIRFFEFCFGIILGECYLEISSKKIKKIPYLFDLIFLLSVLLFIWGASELGYCEYFNGKKFAGNYIFFDVFVLPITGLILLSGAFSDSGFLFSISKSKVCTYLSKLSLSFYLYQIVVLGIGLRYKAIFTDMYVRLILFFIFNLLLASIGYELFEKRLTNLLQKRNRKW